MKRVVFSMSLCLIYILCTAQKVTNVQFEQVNDKVKITYSLDKTADISVSVSTDGGTTWSSPLQHVSGDVGKSISSGSRTIWWDVLSAKESCVGNSICFKVIPKSVYENLTFTVNGVSFTMVYVEGGTFMMGATPEQGNGWFGIENAKPIHKVSLSDYYIGKTEVTQGLWQAVMGTTIYQQKEKHYSPGIILHGVGVNHPMYHISWDEANDFCHKLSKLTGRTFMLPTEAQWEWAARGGKKSKGYQYSGSNDFSSVAWFSYYGETAPVGTKLSNELGIYDMTGNISEWCNDWYGPYTNNDAYNPTGESSNKGNGHVIRGGSFSDCTGTFSRVSYRDAGCPTCTGGLRVVLIP